MCLYADANATMKLRKRKGVCRAWKVYAVEGGALYPPYYGTRQPIIAPGIIKSDRRSIPKRVADGDIIEKGIHVFLSRSRAERLADGWVDRRVVPITARRGDLVASDYGDREAVFMSIHISKTAFRKATKA
jgi:hypothetical protein